MSLTGQTLKQRKDEGIVATTATDTALLITQEQDGSVAKPIELKNLLTDRKDTILGQELPETLSGITLAHNPLRAKPVVANDGNTKAFAGLPVLPSNTAVGANLIDGTIGNISVIDNANMRFGTGDFTIEWFGYTGWVGTGQSTVILAVKYSNSSNSIAFRSHTSGYFGIGKKVDGVSTYGFTNRGVLKEKKMTHIVVVKKGNKIYNYADNIYIPNEYDGDFNSNNDYEGYAWRLAGDSSTYNGDKKPNLVRFFNYALTTAEVSLLWNNGRPDRAVLPEYMKWGSNADITSGTLTIGKRYLIKEYLGTDDFTNVATLISGTINTDDCIFEAKATTPTEWTSESVLIQVGSVASYTGKGLITDSAGKCTSWETDKKIETGIDDSLTATITGTPDLQLIQAEETEGQGLVDSIYKTITTAPMSADGLIGTVPMGWAIDEVLIEKTAGSTSNSLVIRANSTSGTQIGTCSVIAFADSDDDLYTTAMTKKKLSNTANKDVFISGISAGTYIATLRIKKV